MRLSDGEISRQFLEKWDSISDYDKECVTIEIVSLAAGVDPRALLGEILLAAREYSVVKFKLKATDIHPEILEESIKFARLPGGHKDRSDIHTMMGALPRSRTTFIDKFYEASDGKDELEGDTPKGKAIVQPEEMIEDESYVFPDAEVMQDKIHHSRQKFLEAKR